MVETLYYMPFFYFPKKVFLSFFPCLLIFFFFSLPFFRPLPSLPLRRSKVVYFAITLSLSFSGQSSSPSFNPSFVSLSFFSFLPSGKVGRPYCTGKEGKGGLGIREEQPSLLPTRPNHPSERTHSLSSLLLPS